MVVEVGHLTTFYALPQVLGQARTVSEVLGMTTATRIATAVTRQMHPLPRVQRLGPSWALPFVLSQNKIVVMSDGSQ